MAKFDVYALVAIQIEADSAADAQAEAERLPLEFWDDSERDIVEVVAYAD